MTAIKFKNIKSLAKKLKEYVEKNHKLPGELTVGNVTYNYRQIGHLNPLGILVRMLKLLRSLKHLLQLVNMFH